MTIIPTTDAGQMSFNVKFSLESTCKEDVLLVDEDCYAKGVKSKEENVAGFMG